MLLHQEGAIFSLVPVRKKEQSEFNSLSAATTVTCSFALSKLLLGPQEVPFLPVDCEIPREREQFKSSVSFVWRSSRCSVRRGGRQLLPIAAGRRAAALDLLDSTRPSLACSLAFWLLSPVCIALLARKTSDGQEGKGDHRGEGHRPRETHNSEPAERKNSASTFFFLFSRGLREARGKINTSTARASKV